MHTQCCIPLPWPGRLPGGQMCWRAAGPATSGERGCQFSAHGASRCSPAPHARSRAACRRRQSPCSRTRHAAAGRASPAALEPTSTGSQIAAGPPAAAAPTAQEGRQPQRGTGSCTGDSRGQQWQAAATPADSRRRSAGHPLRRPEDRARSPVASTSRTENGVKELRPGRPQLHSHGLWHPPASP